MMLLDECNKIICDISSVECKFPYPELENFILYKAEEFIKRLYLETISNECVSAVNSMFLSKDKNFREYSICLNKKKRIKISAFRSITGEVIDVAFLFEDSGILEYMEIFTFNPPKDEYDINDIRLGNHIIPFLVGEFIWPESRRKEDDEERND